MRNIFISCVICFSSCFYSVSTAEVSVSENKETKNFQENKEVNQEELFNMIKKGVVAIKVRGHVIMERAYNDKEWSGTGFIVDKEKGLIVTNSHVAGEMAVCSYEIKFGNGTKTQAQLKYIDPCYDIAVLSVDPNNIPSQCIALEMSEDPVTVNTAVYAMGNSFGNEFSTYPGTIFDIYSILWLKAFPEQSLQFSGLTVPGASGSPVFRSDGKIIGLLYGGKFVSGAALPISYVKPVIEAIKDDKIFHRYFYGFIVDYMTLQDAIEVGIVDKDLENEYEKQFPDSNNKIIYVTKKLRAFDGSKAIEPGDVIVAIDGTPIGCHLQKLDQIVQSKKGKDISITVYRDGSKKDISVSTHMMESSDDRRLLSFAGATFFETNDDVKVANGTSKKAVFITNSEPGSPFTEVTSSPNDPFEKNLFQITMIDGERITDIDDMIKILPNLMKKKTFSLRYIKVGGDGEEISVTAKYSPEFVESTLYTFDKETLSWIVKSIENPSQIHNN